ncbi:hypothetical protein A6V37_37885 [Paraburkholderia ginsengiterrae]|uniref:Uncharacterized protein n=1 Tax=Paraburkholderia ginsengiterrae TaxID=1462993 RepID=A0A1A9ND27_9BURK|nr:hypothetical protein A6V37_37885 [Paraburkholderia ginsengiterrae]
MRGGGVSGGGVEGRGGGDEVARRADAAEGGARALGGGYVAQWGGGVGKGVVRGWGGEAGGGGGRGGVAECGVTAKKAACRGEQ